MTDTGLKELTALKQLKILDLTQTKVTDAGLKELAALKNLTDLDLHNAPLTADPVPAPSSTQNDSSRPQ